MQERMNRRSFLSCSAAAVLAATSGLRANFASAAQEMSLGDWILPSPNTDYLKDLSLPSLNGLACFGLDFQSDRERFKQVHSMQNGWHALRRLAPLVPHLEIERLKQGRKWGRPYKMDNQQYSPDDGYAAYNIDQLAMQSIRMIVTHLFSDAGYAKYFVDARNGLDNRYGQLARDHTYKFGGALATEFEERKAYLAFIDEAMPIIMRWSQSTALFEDIFTVLALRLPPYNFQGGGFVFSMNQFLKASFSPVNNEERKRLLAMNNFEAGVGRRSEQGVLVKMPADQAEVIVKSTDNSLVYAVLKQRTALPTGVDLTRPLSYESFITSKSIGIYSDATLNTRILEIPIA